MADETPLADSLDLFLGKTIKKMDASACNNIVFLFTDGSKVALHIEMDAIGLPDVLACTHCAEITND
jgi:hypothetical protein